MNMWPWSTIRELRFQLLLRTDAALQDRIRMAEDMRAQAIAKKDWYKGLCYDSYRTIVQQQKGMHRMARKIKRLKAEVERLKLEVATNAYRESLDV